MLMWSMLLSWRLFFYLLNFYSFWGVLAGDHLSWSTCSGQRTSESFFTPGTTWVPGGETLLSDSPLCNPPRPCHGCLLDTPHFSFSHSAGYTIQFQAFHLPSEYWRRQLHSVVDPWKECNFRDLNSPDKKFTGLSCYGFWFIKFGEPGTV